MRTNRRRRAQITAAALSVLVLGLAGPPASAQDSSGVRINEVESSGGSPGDWVELVNTGGTAVDVSGWIVKDDDNSHSYKIASGTSMAPGGYLALDVESSYGLGSADSARLFRADGSTLVDSYSWSDHASTTYGRCPDGTGAFATTTASTKGGPNACAGSQGAWPGGSSVTTADASDVFGENLSGLSFESQSVLWAVDNGPGKLYRLVPERHDVAPDTANGWSSGKSLHYGTGSGDPDAEGVVSTPDGMFVSTERDNDNELHQPAGDPALRHLLRRLLAERHRGVEPDRGPALRGRQHRSRGRRVDPRHLPDRARLPRRAHRRRLRPGRLPGPRQRPVLRRT